MLGAAVMFSGANCALGQFMPPLSADTPEYKCHVLSSVNGVTVIRFYDRRDLPARFSDAETVGRAAIPDSLRNTLSAVYECVLASETFSNPFANSLEQQVPQ